MLIAATPTWLNIAGIVFGIIVGLATLYALFIGARYLVKSARIRTNNELADSAVASLQAANQALESRLTIVERDNEHCIEMKRQQDLVIAQLTGSVEELRSWVTARDLITELTAMTRGGFLALHVDPAALDTPKAKS